MRKICRRGFGYICFGAGVLLAFCFPTWFVVFTLCILVILGGVCIFR